MPKNTYLFMAAVVLHEIKFHTSKYMNSFFPNCVKSWNTIGDELHSRKTISKL